MTGRLSSYLHKQKEGKLRTNVFCKQTSSLTAKEQKKYLYLLQKYSNAVLGANTPEEEKKAIETLMDLHKKVVEEQKKFEEYQKCNAKSYIDYNFVHPEAARYVKELVQKKLQSSLSYPRHYIIKEKLSLLEDVNIDVTALPSLVCNLLELGRVPKLISPDLDNCNIPCNYAKMCRRFSFNITSENSEKHPSKQPISQDSIAKTLADKHSADVVLSFSSLKHLLICRSLDSNTSWELPVTVASFPSTDGTDCCVKRVFIDKAIPAETWRSSRKNAVYHKYGVKLQFTHFKPFKGNRKTRSFYQGRVEGKQDREIVKLQDGFFETETFLHETFGQVSASSESKVPVNEMNEGSMESEVKSFDAAIHKSPEEKCSQKKDEKNHTVALKEESLINNANSTTKAELDNDKSKENELPTKETDIVDKAIAGNTVTDKCYRRISFVAESRQSENNNDVDKNESSPSASLEQIKKGSNNKEEKTSDDLEESPKGKKRKAKFEPSEVLPGRRVTRSQTKKLEDTVKKSKFSKLHNFKQKAQSRKEEDKTKQNTSSQLETTAESSSQKEKDNNQNSDEVVQKTESLESVQENSPLKSENVNKETELFGSDTSNDSFPKSPSKKIACHPKLLMSSDDESEDNLVIDENVLSSDEKLKDTVKLSDDMEVDRDSVIEVNMLTSEPACNDKPELENKTTNIQDVPNKTNANQAEKIQSVVNGKILNDKNELSSGDKENNKPFLENLLQLQTDMMPSRQKPFTSPEGKPQVSSVPPPGLPTYLEDASQFPSLDPSLNINVQYSLWNMGQLKIIMRSRLDSRQLSSIPCFIFPKLEYQSQFGGEICSKQELLYQWITLLCHPGSIGLRVRVDARSSKVLLVENLTLPKMHNLVAEFSPEKPLCWIMDIFEKLKGLPDGNYLLAYKKKEDVVTLYAATEGNKRGNFDLHTTIRHRLVALDDDNSGWRTNDSETDIPWLPIDPVLMLPALIRRGRIPATFPPAKGSEPMYKEKKKNSKKKSKKKSKISKMKAKLQKN